MSRSSVLLLQGASFVGICRDLDDVPTSAVNDWPSSLGDKTSLVALFDTSPLGLLLVSSASKLLVDTCNVSKVGAVCCCWAEKGCGRGLGDVDFCFVESCSVLLNPWLSLVLIF